MLRLSAAGRLLYRRQRIEPIHVGVGEQAHGLALQDENVAPPDRALDRLLVADRIRHDQFMSTNFVEASSDSDVTRTK